MQSDSRPAHHDSVLFTVDGRPVEVHADGGSLLEVLRDRLGVRSPKDGCSPQGQCGCCTVWVDGAPRVSCVTPVRRLAGRTVTTLDGLDPSERHGWADAFCATGASQCGFCSPGIIMRLASLRKGVTGAAPVDRQAVERALQAHLCRCTGWRTILEAWEAYGAVDPREDRDLDAASLRATLEGGAPQRVGPHIALGDGGFADDLAPPDALVAVQAANGEWIVAETLSEARAAAGKVQGRRTTAESRPPLELPPGDWTATLRTSWVEPAYLETDASWCLPGELPASPLANGGAFGAKVGSDAGVTARRLADRHGRAVRVLFSREDVVRNGPKRPPVAGGATPDGRGVMRVVRTPGIAAAISQFAGDLVTEEVDVVGPPTSATLRGAGWAEAAVLLAGARGAAGPVRGPSGAVAEAEVSGGHIRVRVACGDPLDEVVLRSYCIGATHMALGWVTSEGLAVDEEGEVHDLTIRSFGVRRAADTPHIDVELDATPGEPVNGSDAVFAAVAAAVWIDEGSPQDWPTRGARR